MFLTLILLAILFIVGLINTFHHLPTKKFKSWFQSQLLNNTSPKSLAPKKQSISHKKLNELKRVFSTFDKNGDGYITNEELRESLKNVGMVMTEKDIQEMVEKLDRNGDGLLDFNEFCDLFESIVSREGGEDGKGEGGEEEEVDLKEAFDVFDGDKNGLITVEELGLILSSLGLKEGKKIEDCKEMIRKVDMDGDGMVNFDEFKKMMKAGGMLVSPAS